VQTLCFYAFIYKLVSFYFVIDICTCYLYVFHTLFLGVLVKYDICDIVLTACSVHSGKTVACMHWWCTSKSDVQNYNWFNPLSAVCCWSASLFNVVYLVIVMLVYSGSEKGWRVFYHFVGTMPGSTELLGLLCRLHCCCHLLNYIEYIDRVCVTQRRWERLACVLSLCRRCAWFYRTAGPALSTSVRGESHTSK